MYFEPIRLGMPQNCSADVQAVIAHVDQVFTSGSPSDIDSVKANFELQNITHLDDVAGALRMILVDWQNLGPDTGIEGSFFKFCDALEVKNGIVAPASGFGLDDAFAAWGNFWKNNLANLCGGSDVDQCLGTHDALNPFYTNTRVDNWARSWTWIVCNEVGFYQVSAPVGYPTLVSRLLQPEYDAKLCTYYPEKFQIPPVPTVDAVNQAYGGWNIDIDHIFFANGRRDPWLEATVSAQSSPYRANDTRPVGVSDGFHGSDLVTFNAFVDSTVAAVQNQGLAAIGAWLAEFRPASTSGNETKVGFERE